VAGDWWRVEEFSFFNFEFSILDAGGWENGKCEMGDAKWAEFSILNFEF